jgi:hypothetical protein
MPGNGFSLTVMIAGQIDGRDVFDGILEAGDHFLLTIVHHIDGFELMRDIHAHIMFGKIAYMAHGGFDDKLVFEELGNRAGFGRRFHYDQTF